MKKIVKSTLAVIALATLTSQAANAQSSTSKVNSRERILQVLDQSRPNEYVPAAFFLHFENKLGRKAVQDHKDFYRATNMDFVKVFYEISVPKIDIQSGKDWAKVPVYGEDFFEPQVAVIADLAREFGGEAFILPTVYSPLALAGQTLGFGNRKNLKKLIEEDPKAFGQAIKNLSLSIENYLPASMVPTVSTYLVREVTAIPSLLRFGISTYVSGISMCLKLPQRLVRSIFSTSATMVHHSRMLKLSTRSPTIQQASLMFL